MSDIARFMQKKLGGKYNVGAGGEQCGGSGGGLGGGRGGSEGQGGGRGGGGGSVLDALLPQKVNEVMEDSRTTQTRIISSKAEKCLKLYVKS